MQARMDRSARGRGRGKGAGAVARPARVAVAVRNEAALMLGARAEVVLCKWDHAIPPPALEARSTPRGARARERSDPSARGADEETHGGGERKGARRRMGPISGKEAAAKGRTETRCPGVARPSGAMPSAGRDK